MSGVSVLPNPITLHWGQELQIKLFIIGEIRLHRDGVAALFESIPEIEIQWSGPSTAALEAMAELAPDAALLDDPTAELIDFVAALRRQRPSLSIVAIGGRDAESEVLACAAAGIDAYMRKDSGPTEIVATIMEILRDGRPRAIAEAGALAPATGLALTNRELQVVELIDRGYSNKEISQRLSIEICTTKNHVQSILQKLGVHRRGQAAAMLRRSIGQRLAG